MNQDNYREDPPFEAAREPKSKTEQLSIAIKMRDDMVANDHPGRPDSILKQYRRQWRTLTPRLRELIGEVVIASAWLEETTNTYLQYRSGTWDTRADKYGTPASTLADGIEAIPETRHLAEQYREVMKRRNQLVHGVILMMDGPKPYWSLKHQLTGKKTKQEPPVREEWKFDLAELESLADAIWDVQDELKMKSDELRRAQSTPL